MNPRNTVIKICLVTCFLCLIFKIWPTKLAVTQNGMWRRNYKVTNLFVAGGKKVSSLRSHYFCYSVMLACRLAISTSHSDQDFVQINHTIHCWLLLWLLRCCEQSLDLVLLEIKSLLQLTQQYHIFLSYHCKKWGGKSGTELTVYHLKHPVNVYSLCCVNVWITN